VNLESLNKTASPSPVAFCKKEWDFLTIMCASHVPARRETEVNVQYGIE